MSGRRTVARSLRLLVAELSVIIVLISLVSIASIIVIQREVRETASTITPLVETSTRLRLGLTEARAHHRDVLVDEDPEALERYRSSKQTFARGRDEFLASATDAGLDRDQVEAFLDAGDAWVEEADASMAAGPGEGADEPGSSARTFNRVIAEHEALTTEIANERQERRDRYGAAMSRAVALMVLAALLALGITGYRGRRAVKHLAVPLQDLHQVVTRHRRGSLDARADETHGAAEVVALASVFNAMAAESAAVQQERERRLDLFRVTGKVPSELLTREGGWSRACAGLGSGLGVDAVSIYRVTGDDAVSLLGSWNTTGADFPAVLHDVDIPGVARMLAETPILRAGSREESRLFPGPLSDLAERRNLSGWVLHPLCFRDEAVGVLSVATLEPKQWDEAEIQAMQRVADYAAHALVEQRYVASLEELDQQKSDFMATTSHELRTPLTSIAGYLELLEDGDYGPLTEPQTRALDVVSRNVQRLRSLIDDLLLLNRLDSGQATTERVVYDVGRSTARVAEQLAPVAGAARVELVLEQQEEPVVVRADPTQIERAIGNLVSNAIKFTPEGGCVRLTSTVHGDEVRIACSDTGMGIPQADQAQLFTRFFRASNAQEGQVPGTGLGLVIVRTIAESHGGGVDISSVEGEGTTVTISLPALASVR